MDTVYCSYSGTAFNLHKSCSRKDWKFESSQIWWLFFVSCLIFIAMPQGVCIYVCVCRERYTHTHICIHIHTLMEHFLHRIFLFYWTLFVPVVSMRLKIFLTNVIDSLIWRKASFCYMLPKDVHKQNTLHWNRRLVKVLYLVSSNRVNTCSWRLPSPSVFL